MNVSNFRALIAALTIGCVSAGSVIADIPAGWTIAGSAPTDYEFSRDGTTAVGGKFSASIDAKPGANGFGISHAANRRRQLPGRSMEVDWSPEN